MGSFTKKSNSYHYQFYHNGQKIRRSLKTADKRLAEQRARELERKIRDASTQEEIDQTKNKNIYPTLENICELYKQACQLRQLSGNRMIEKTARRNIRSLEIITSDLKQSVTCLTPANLDKYAMSRLTNCKGQDLIKTRNTIESHCRRARSVFSDWANKVYQQNGLRLPDLTEWKKHRSVKQDHGTYRVPLEHPELVEWTLSQGSALVRNRDYLSVGWLCSYELALRAKESACLRWDWFIKRGEHYGLLIIDRPDQDFSVKGTNREIQVHKSLYQILKACWEHNGGSGEHVCLGASFNARLNYICRDLSKFVRDCGFTADKFEKAGHELRKLKGSEWFSDPRLGPAVAQEWLGHKDISTTCKYYASLTNNVLPPEPQFLQT